MLTRISRHGEGDETVQWFPIGLITEDAAVPTRQTPPVPNRVKFVTGRKENSVSLQATPLSSILLRFLTIWELSYHAQLVLMDFAVTLPLSSSHLNPRIFTMYSIYKLFNKLQDDLHFLFSMYFNGNVFYLHLIVHENLSRDQSKLWIKYRKHVFRCGKSN